MDTACVEFPLDPEFVFNPTLLMTDKELALTRKWELRIRRIRELQRFWRYVRFDESGCWLWDGYKDRNGYGKLCIGSRTDGTRRFLMAHVFSYEAIYKAVPEGLCLDHLCRVRNCVNPEHLEAVTPGVNTLRGESFSAKNARKTHCIHGHPLTPENLWKGRPPHGNPNLRRCLTCKRISHQARRKRIREEARENGIRIPRGTL